LAHGVVTKPQQSRTGQKRKKTKKRSPHGEMPPEPEGEKKTTESHKLFHDKRQAIEGAHTSTESERTRSECGKLSSKSKNCGENAKPKKEGAGVATDPKRKKKEGPYQHRTKKQLNGRKGAQKKKTANPTADRGTRTFDR